MVRMGRGAGAREIILHNPINRSDETESAEAKLERLRSAKRFQEAPGLLKKDGVELTPEEETLVLQWAQVNVQMAETAHLFGIKKQVEPFSTYPGGNGCSTCCNYAGCSVVP